MQERLKLKPLQYNNMYKRCFTIDDFVFTSVMLKTLTPCSVIMIISVVARRNKVTSNKKYKKRREYYG